MNETESDCVGADAKGTPFLSNGFSETDDG